MNFGDTSIMQLSKAKLRYLGQREAVLAANIANADTPGYKALDLKQPDFAGMLSGKLGSGTMARTNARHMLPGGVNSNFVMEERASAFERKPDDNRVDIDQEVQQVSFTQTEYNKVISIYRKNVGFYKLALGQGQGG